MELLVLRHAEAESFSGGRDEDRPLTDAGKAAMGALGRLLARLGVLPDKAFTSPFVRCEETVMTLLGAAEAEADIEFAPGLRPGASPMGIIDLLTAKGGGGSRFLIVGHQPDIGRFVGSLIGDERSALAVSPGTLLRVDVDHPGKAWSGRLVWMLTPDFVEKVEAAGE